MNIIPLRRWATLACSLPLYLASATTLAAAHNRPPTLDPTYGLHTRAVRSAQVSSKVDAEWIWTDSVHDNQTVYLRRTFTIASVPKTVTAYVTADDYFTLYVNGHLAAESHSDPSDSLVWKHVRRVDITKYLVGGKNVVAIKAINAGGAAGAIARIETLGRPLDLTGPLWKATEQTPPDAWTDVAFNDATWPGAHVVGALITDPWASAGGLENWPGYEAGIPYLQHLTLPVVGYSDATPGAVEGLASVTKPEATRITIAPSGAQPTPAPGAGGPANPGFVVDFGKEIAGRVEIRAEGVGVVEVATGESREEAIKAPWGGIHKIDFSDRKPAWTPYSAFRYARISAPVSASPTALVITRITVDHKYYPVTYRGAFSCSDELLTRLWYTGAYTAHLCMQEDIWDAPKRDRARWMGDLHVSGEVIDDVFEDRFLMEQTMRRLRNDAQGGGAPTDTPKSHVNGIPGYSCAWVCGVADLFRHIGDEAYLEEQHPLIISMLDYLNGELDENDLFVNKRKSWPFVDWSPGFNGDHPLALQATQFFIIKALHEGAFLLDQLDDKVNADRFRLRAADMTAAAQKAYLHADTQTFSDRRQDNAMAIYSGVATPEETSAIYDRVLRPDSQAWNQVATPYYNNYVIEAMSRAGHNRDALQVLRTHWGGMLAEGATSFWEGYDPAWEKSDFHAHLQADDGTGYFVSLCHGWSAAPTSFLTDRVLGIRPTSGGFKTVDIVPDLGGLSWAEGDVPTPRGLLHVRVDEHAGSFTLNLNIPRGVVATVGLPGTKIKFDNRRFNPDHIGDGRTYIKLTTPGRYKIDITKGGGRAHPENDKPVGTTPAAGAKLDGAVGRTSM